jgi:hypothetical protein
MDIPTHYTRDDGSNDRVGKAYIKLTTLGFSNRRFGLRMRVQRYGGPST